MFGPAHASKTRNTNIDRVNDRFYTKQHIADQCINELINVIDVSKIKCWFEPGVGKGSFVNSYFSIVDTHKDKKLIVNDLDKFITDNSEISIYQQDFLTFSDVSESPLIIFGNPPFGKNASTAISFFNHAAKFSQVIAFIVPRSFRKLSIINRLDQNFHLIHETILEKKCFHYQGQEVDVPCVWSIWVHTQHTSLMRNKPDFTPNILRPIKTQITTSDILSFTSANDASLMIQRVGAAAGKVVWDKNKIQEKSKSRNYYFIKINNINNIKILQQNKFDMSEFPGKYDTAGMPSITKPDVIQEIHNFIDKNNKNVIQFKNVKLVIVS